VFISVVTIVAGMDEPKLANVCFDTQIIVVLCN